MAKPILGIDIGYSQLKLVLMTGNKVKKAVTVPMPERLLREGRVVSTESMSELLRQTIKENGLRCRQAALVIPRELSYVRSVTMPQMTADQLLYNLPYEFRDYITDELKNYIFDYAMISTPEDMQEGGKPQDRGENETDGEANAPTMDLLAAAVSREYIEEVTGMIRKAGMKLVKAAPPICAYIPFIRKLDAGEKKEYCLLDIGQKSIRMYMFHGECHEVSREIEIGMETIEQAIADQYNVDIHLAHTYLLTNHEDCRKQPVCTDLFERIGIELMRALHFYEFSNPDRTITDIWVSGGGCGITGLLDAISENTGKVIHPAEELIDDIGEDAFNYVQAAGICLE